MAKRKNGKGGEYEVGHGKPPANTRFPKGKSGNPKGRPKGSRNFQMLLLDALNETVVVPLNGKATAMTRLELMVTQLAHKGASGDPIATARIIQNLLLIEAKEVDSPNMLDAEEDRRVLENIMKRMRPKE